MGSDASAYLPWDLRGPMRAALGAVAPDLVAFTKTEVWPVMVEEARAAGAKVALIAATLPPGAGRLSRPARALLGPTWRHLTLVAAIAEEDAERLIGLGVPREAVRVTGDPGIDSAASRAGEADPRAPYLAPFHADPRPTVVAGSTWPADDAVLLPALDAVRRDHTGVRAVLAPHEPDRVHVEALLGDLRRRGWNAAPLAEVEREGAEGVDAVVVDRVGILAHLYTVGSAAYVGGGFHDRGLHSVLEPAAAKLPVAFGPRHGNARAAADLVACGGGRAVADPAELAEALAEWLGASGGAEWAGERAFGYIHGHLGAADRTAALLDELLPERST
jgi:3-deoxy-D-manno-octulosonic-acid transferase